MNDDLEKRLKDQFKNPSILYQSFAWNILRIRLVRRGNLEKNIDGDRDRSDAWTFQTLHHSE